MADIDVEDENILTTIFKDSFPESWQENPDFLQYLVELSSYGADRLSREPERLAEEKSQILSETQDLAFHNYTTFIQTADCSKEIFQDFQIIEQHLGELISKLPELSSQCHHVVNKAQEISASRRMNSLTLQRHTQLLEVLEMPQLMDTCVRNGYTEEALELGAHVKRLEKKHGNVPVIASIVEEVKASTQLLLTQLIQQLRTNLQLPACLRVIGYLRRMDVFTEAELRITFLQARDAWFQSILEAIPWTDPYTHISKTIEASRVHLFDIMTQFRAIFSDEDPLVSSGRAEPVTQSLIFHSWVLQKISQFLATLENDLAQGAGGRLDSILGQCMYFGLSFSRVGADFRGLLAPIFERAAINYFASALKEANKKFEENMQSYNLLGLTTTGGLPFGMGASQSGQLYPPTALLDFYPLAAYCNHVLAAFNDLRLCSPLTLACRVAEELQRSLLEVNRVILAFHRAEETTFNPKERDQFEQFCAGYAADLLPYMNKCLQAVFPPAQLAQALGLSVSEINRKVCVGQVDLNAVLSNIEHLMPTPPPPPEPSTVQALANANDEPTEPVTFTLDSAGAEEEEGEGEEKKKGEELEERTSTTGVATASDADAAAVSAGAVSMTSDDSKDSSDMTTETSTEKALSTTSAIAGAGLDIPLAEPQPSSVVAEEVEEKEDGGGWNTEPFDLDNLDNLTFDPSGPSVDLDLLPTPAGSEVSGGAGKSDAKQD
ncbi:conserved oligomeric Golgi complex subunit 8 [Aplysia californica]|uniref:Conserved oligomeric Golgi complex subunit 8 n=1 Tax=Aplysia californica TaxID=6500 RepID=A0ABM1ACR5_APLCA|nr:conserved oligomeric Golgi complex subunit 8 [Aplysia californica]